MTSKTNRARPGSRGNPEAESRIVAEVYKVLGRANADPDDQQEIASKMVALHRAGTFPKNLKAYVAKALKSRKVDAARKRDVAARAGERERAGAPAHHEPPEVASLADLRAATIAIAEREARKRAWPGFWWACLRPYLVAQKCGQCKGLGALVDRPSSEWTRGAAGLFPPVCGACEGSGRAFTESSTEGSSEDDDRARKRQRKTARERAHDAKRRGDARGSLRALIEANNSRPRELRGELVRQLCSLASPDAFSPTARDLGLAALLAGDWPKTAKRQPSQVISAMTTTMREAHGRALKRGLVSPLRK